MTGGCRSGDYCGRSWPRGGGILGGGRRVARRWGRRQGGGASAASWWYDDRGVPSVVLVVAGVPTCRDKR
jgi:hypothetical protein